MKKNYHYIDYVLTPVFYVVVLALLGIVKIEFPKILYFYLIAVIIHFLIKNTLMYVVKAIKKDIQK